MFAYRLAKDLGLRISDVLDMSLDEFMGWMAFYKYEHEEQKRAQQKARSR
jgi:hypothetical protein